MCHLCLKKIPCFFKKETIIERKNMNRMHTMQLKFIGTSSGEPIPRQDCRCKQCKSADRKDKRLRPSILIDKKILVDAGPDILKQLRRSQIVKLNTLIITHEHDDHVGGLKYILKFNPNIRIIRMKPGQHFKLFGIDFFAFKVEHSRVLTTIGLEINDVAYIPDSSSLLQALKYLREVKIAILDGSSLGRSFGGHMSINEIITFVKPLSNLKAIYFTHNGHTRKTHKELNSFVKQMGDKRFQLAYDGLELKV